jgi:hypothetical protein
LPDVPSDFHTLIPHIVLKDNSSLSVEGMQADCNDF